MAETPKWWVGTDETGGIPNPGRPDPVPPPNWRLEMVAATERPRQCELSPDGTTVAFMLDRDTSDVWTVPVAGGEPSRVTDRPSARRVLGGRQRGLVARRHRAGVHPGGQGDGGRRRRGRAARRVRRVGPVWLDDARLVVGVERGDATVLAVVDDRRRLAAAHRRARAPTTCTAVVSPDRSRLAYTVFHRDDLNCTSACTWSISPPARPRTVVHQPGFQLREPGLVARRHPSRLRERMAGLVRGVRRRRRSARTRPAASSPPTRPTSHRSVRRPTVPRWWRRAAATASPIWSRIDAPRAR